MPRRPHTPLRLLSWLAQTALVLGVGCGDEEPGLDLAVDELIDTTNSTAQIWCECAPEYGYGGNVAACEDAAGYILQGRADCLHAAFGQDEEASQGFLMCLLDAASAYNGCIYDRLLCPPGKPPLGCNQGYLDAVQACGSPPSAVADALDECGNQRLGPPLAQP